MDQKKTRIRVEVSEDNLPMTVGALVEGFNDLREDLGIFIRQYNTGEEKNSRQHDEILSQIKRHEDYLIVFRVSSCVLKGLKDRDNLKIAAVILGAFGLDFLARYITALIK